MRWNTQIKRDTFRELTTALRSQSHDRTNAKDAWTPPLGHAEGSLTLALAMKRPLRVLHHKRARVIMLFIRPRVRVPGGPEERHDNSRCSEPRDSPNSVVDTNTPDGDLDVRGPFLRRKFSEFSGSASWTDLWTVSAVETGIRRPTPNT